MADSFQQAGVVTLPLLCLVISEMVGASMFIAAFVAGLAVQVGFKEKSRHSLEFAEQLGQILNLSVFFLFGIFVVRDWRQFDLASVLYAALSLTVIRMLPVAIALIGTGLSRPTVVFMGWFGPRGLASIVLGLVYLEQQMHLSGEPTIRVRSDDDRAAQHLCARLERCARHRHLRAEDRVAPRRRPRTSGIQA